MNERERCKPRNSMEYRTVHLWLLPRGLKRRPLSWKAPPFMEGDVSHMSLWSAGMLGVLVSVIGKEQQASTRLCVPCFVEWGRIQKWSLTSGSLESRLLDNMLWDKKQILKRQRTKHLLRDHHPCPSLSSHRTIKASALEYASLRLLWLRRTLGLGSF